MKEIQCEDVEVTKFRTEIKSECRTKKDQVNGQKTGKLEVVIVVYVDADVVVVGLQCHQQRGANPGVSSIRGAKVDT